ncbi:MAG: DNA-binding response regulator [Chitinophagaceae bacterium]|nr:MAG: DNA-binding response regulator [Chitinophagaceae bacterium]
MQNKILVVEDDQRVSSIIKRGLEENGYEVQQAWNGLSGKEMLQNNLFDLAIVDIVMPEMNGLDLCAAIRKEKPNFPIIMLTALGTTDDKVEGFDAGADDYLVKPFDLRELLARIKVLLKRTRRPVEKEITKLEYADMHLDINRKTLFRSGKEITLTPKEFSLLMFMMKNPERVLSRKEISKKVWDMDFDTGTNFIDVYINYLRKKVDRDFEQKLLHTKPGMGFILKKDN